MKALNEIIRFMRSEITHVDFIMGIKPSQGLSIAGSYRFRKR